MKCVDLAWRLAVCARTSETNAGGAARVVVRVTLEADDADDAMDGDGDARFEQMEMSVTQFYALANAARAARDAMVDADARA